ncbi:MAG: hypothetical protein M3Q46_13040 [Verrucomicrobiota bacterium]|nr:hypothetical protein [Verrucomicrobiota bacterium]
MFARDFGRPSGLGEALLLVLLTGTIDWFSGYEVSMSLFYGAPIMAAV